MEKALGQLIENARLAAKLSRESVAESLDVATTTVLRWEKGELAPSFSNVVKLSKTLHKDLGYFTGVSDESGPESGEITASELVDINKVIVSLRGVELELLRNTIKTLSKPKTSTKKLKKNA